MRVSKAVIASSVGIMLCSSLAACGGDDHKPVDTSKLFGVQSSFGSEFKTQTKGPMDIDPKLLSQKLPVGVSFEPDDCRDYVTGGPLPKGSRGRMSRITASGGGNQFDVIAAQTYKDVPFDAESAEKCKHVTFELEKGQGRVSGFVDEVEAPQIEGARTEGLHWQIETSITVGEGEQEQHKDARRDVYRYTANLGDVLVLVTVSAVPTADQPMPMVDTDRARQLLSDSVAAVRR